MNPSSKGFFLIFLTEILHHGFRNCFFSFTLHLLFSNFYLNFYILFLFGLLFSFYSWTFFLFHLVFPPFAFEKNWGILFCFRERPLIMSDSRGEGGGSKMTPKIGLQKETIWTLSKKKSDIIFFSILF